MNTRRRFFFSVAALASGAFAPSLVLASGGANKAPAQESNFVAISQITASITNGVRPVGIMQVDVGIYTTDAALKARLANMLPILKSHWRAALQDFVSRYYTAGYVPDANILSGLLQRAIDPILAPSRGRVLIQAIIAR